VDMPSSAISAPLRPRAGYLPAEVNSFVGRRRELEEVRRLFTRSPMVTIVGPGGVGKTRLAVRTGASLARTFRDGVWLAELANLHDPALVTQAIADAMGVPEDATGLSDRSLIDQVADKHLLLVLDNCEHLLEDTARIADGLLKGAPELRILATSREPLGIPGETAMRLTPLLVPHPSRASSAMALTSYEAVRLFQERAVAADPDFELTDENCTDVARICRQLDGIPLAIELAAARVRTLAPKQLADRLTDLFQVLTSGSRVAPPRHRTLRHCIDWSYQQCSVHEQLLWKRLAVFVGTFELEAVEGVCAFDGIDQKDILDLVASLVDKSIVSREVRRGATYFKLLESLRSYGREKLTESGEEIVMCRRHADWYHRSVARFEADLLSSKQAQLAEALDAELPNVRETLDFSLGPGEDYATALTTINAMYLYWISRGLLSEGRYWLGRALADTDSTVTHDRVVALYSALCFAGLQGDLDGAREAAQASRSLIRQLDKPDAEAFRATIEAVLAVFEGDPQRALEEFPKAIDGHHRNGDLYREVEMLVAHGFALAVTGDEPGSAACHERVLEITRPRGENWYQAYSLWASGLAAWRRGDLARARKVLEESLRLRRLMSDSTGSVWSLVVLTLVIADAGEAERAAVLLGATRSLSAAAGTPASVFPELTEAVTRCGSSLARTLGQTGFDKAVARGRQLDVFEAVTFALDERAPKQADAEAAWSVLTKREGQVASLVARGLTNKEIAAKLVISERTAEGHVENILTKLAYTSRTQIAAWVADQQQRGAAPPS
jgi:predicted ATPase/DNA-binding CsgD family transcriptional regulator